MKIALLGTSLSERGGGVFEVLRNLAVTLSCTCCCTVRVFGVRGREEQICLSGWGESTVDLFDIRGPQGFGFAPGLAGAVSRANCDIVHTHGLWTYPSVVSSKLRGGHRPYVISPHGMLDPWALANSAWKKRLASALFEKTHLEKASCIHALNRAEVAAIRGAGLKNPVCVVPCGTNLPERIDEVGAPWKSWLPHNSSVLLYLGRFHPKKGLRNLLAAWGSAAGARANWHLVLAGWDQGGHEAELKKFVSAHGLQRSVHFIGPQFGQEKAACLASANAFVLPSFSEGMPISVLESWSYGLPVLMTPHCNLSDGFEARAAICVQASMESIASGLATLFTMDRDSQRAMGNRGLQLVSERYSWSAIGRQMFDVYQWVLGRGQQPSFVEVDITQS